MLRKLQSKSPEKKDNFVASIKKQAGRIQRPIYHCFDQGIYSSLQAGTGAANEIWERKTPLLFVTIEVCKNRWVKLALCRRD